MFNNKPVLALIPARGGSKGLPGKNIMLFAGKPLIAWTIEEAKKSKYIDRLIVSTDSEEIAEISRKFGAEVPFLRPEKISTDSASTIDVIEDALNRLINFQSSSFEYCILLQPTSPLRTVKHINESFGLLNKNDQSDSVISVQAIKENPHWMKKINENGFLEDLLDTNDNYNRRQDLPNYYRFNGAIYLFSIKSFLKSKKIMSKKTLPYIMGEKSSVDIDTLSDFERAIDLFKSKE